MRAAALTGLFNFVLGLGVFWLGWAITFGALKFLAAGDLIIVIIGYGTLLMGLFMILAPLMMLRLISNRAEKALSADHEGLKLYSPKVGELSISWSEIQSLEFTNLEMFSIFSIKVSRELPGGFRSSGSRFFRFVGQKIELRPLLLNMKPVEMSKRMNVLRGGAEDKG